MLIYCEKCGAPYNEFFFCERCGHMLGEEEARAYNDEKKKPESESDRDAAYDKIVGADKTDPRSESDTKALIVTLSIALMLLVILAVLLFQR